MVDTSPHSLQPAPTAQIVIQRIVGLPRTGKHLLKWYSHLSIWHRLVLGALLGALGGSTFIGFLNTYALYRYAFRYDARIPVEGVPYLGLAASVLSFAFLFMALSCATLIYGLLRASTALIRTGFSSVAAIVWKLLRPSMEADHRRTAGWLSIVSSILSGFLTAVVSAAAWQPSLGSFEFKRPELVLVAVIGVAGVGLTVLSIYPNWVRWIALYLTLALVMLTAAALFIPEFYAARLRQIGYGGGTPTTLICKDEQPCVPGRRLNLFLITSDTYVLYDVASREYVEVPKTSVQRVQYNPDLEYELPQNTR